MVEIVKTRLVALGDVVHRIDRTDPSKTEGVFTYVDLGSVDQDRKSIQFSKSVSSSEAPSRARQVLKTSDVLVSTVRPNLNGVARVPANLDGSIASTGFCVLRPKVEYLDPLYLFHWVQSSLFVDDMVRKATGASYPAVSNKLVLGSYIPLPPIDEQRRIAAILDKADELRTKRRRALAHLGTLIEAVFTEMFGDPTSAPKSVPFSDLATRITYGFTSPMDHVSAGIPILTGKNVLMGTIDMENVHYGTPHQVSALTDKSKPNLGDILVTKDGTIGRCAVVRSVPICINQSVALVQLQRDKVLPEYVQGMLSHPSVQLKLHGMKKGNSIPHLQITEFAKMRVPLPALELQQSYSAKVFQVEKMRRHHTAQLLELDVLFASLQHRAFRGELS